MSRPWKFLLLFLFTFSLFSQFGFAEQTLDSEDALSVAQVTASDRCQKGKFKEALAAEQNALEIAENRYGPTHSSLVFILTDLASLDRHMALYPEAESNLRWALAIQERNFGVEDPQCAETLYQLSSLYFDWGHWEDAEFYLQKSLDLMDKKEGGPRDWAASAQALELSGQIAMIRQRKEKALSSLKRSQEAWEKDPETGALRLINIGYLLAQAYQLSSRPADEKACLEKNLQLAQSRFKPNAVEVADALQKLADFYQVHNQEDKAKPLYDSALKIYQGCVGSYFGYSSLPYVQKLARAEETAGLWKEAADLLQKELEASQGIYGSKHPGIAVVLFDLSKAQKGLGQKDAAQKSLKQALQIAKAFYRDDHPLVVRIQKEINK